MRSTAGTRWTASATCPATSAGPGSSSPSTPRSSPPRRPDRFPLAAMCVSGAYSRRKAPWTHIAPSSGGTGLLLVPIARASPVDGDVLALQVVEHALVATLAADAALL